MWNTILMFSQGNGLRTAFVGFTAIATLFVAGNMWSGSVVPELDAKQRGMKVSEMSYDGQVGTEPCLFLHAFSSPFVSPYKYSSPSLACLIEEICPFLFRYTPSHTPNQQTKCACKWCGLCKHRLFESLQIFL